MNFDVIVIITIPSILKYVTLKILIQFCLISLTSMISLDIIIDH